MSLIQKAKLLFPEGNDPDYYRDRRHLQKQWIRAITILRTKTKHGWVMDASVAKQPECQQDHRAGDKVISIQPKAAYN